jgi:uncharacterized protein with GYD domain
MIKESGGTLESFYFAFGDADVYIICDLPDATSAAAICLAVNASSTVDLKTITSDRVAQAGAVSARRAHPRWTP